MNNPQALRLKELIEQYDNIIILGHVNPDGDCLSAQVALREYIRINYNSKYCIAVGDVNKDWPDMGKEYQLDEYTLTDNQLSNFLCIVVDFGAKDRCNRVELMDKCAYTFKIDHHKTSEKFTDEELWYPNYAATGQMLAELCWKDGIFKYTNKTIAQMCLFGMYTDTGRFTFDSTTAPDFFRSVDFCHYHGATIKAIVGNSKKDIRDVRLNGYLTSMFETRGKVAYLKVTDEIWNKTSEFMETEDSQEIYEILCSKPWIMGKMEGYPVWVIFIPVLDENGVRTNNYRARIRSAWPVSILKVSESFGGGGHNQAAGCEVTEDTIDTLINVLDNI